MGVGAEAATESAPLANSNGRHGQGCNGSDTGGTNCVNNVTERTKESKSSETSHPQRRKPPLSFVLLIHLQLEPCYLCYLCELRSSLRQELPVVGMVRLVDLSRPTPPQLQAQWLPSPSSPMPRRDEPRTCPFPTLPSIGLRSATVQVRPLGEAGQQVVRVLQEGRAVSGA